MAKEATTRYGLPNASESLEKFHEIGLDTLTKLLEAVESPHQEKVLRTWGITEAAEMVNRTPQNIRQLEKDDGLLGKPMLSDKGKRVYSLERINKIRDILGTRYTRPEGSKPIILAVTNFKGGCAKSTTSVHLAQKCALEGLRVLLIDLDPQATTTLLFGLLPDTHLDIEDTIVNALLDDPKYIKKVARQTYFTGIDLIPANLSIQDAEYSLPNGDINNRQTLGSPLTRLVGALDLIKNDYDVIIMDCGPNTGALTVNAISAANSILVPIPPAMENFGSFVTFVSSLSTLCRAVKPSLDFFRILLAKHTSSIEARMIAAMMREKYPSFILENHMVTTVEIEKASTILSSVYEADKPLKDARAYRRAIESLNAVNNEIIDIFKEIWNAQAEANYEPKLAVNSR